MKYKQFTKEIWQEIDRVIKNLSSKSSGKMIAAFDADGTLWDTDLGENFFNYLIDNKLVELPEDPWGYYRDLKSKNPNAAYLWLAQICQGKSLNQIQTWCTEAVKTLHPVPIFEDQRRLIRTLLDFGAEIYVVTASVSWSVQAGVHLLGLNPESVIGVETVVENGIITDRQNGVITYREGKVEALLKKTGGVKPFFASGNTESDIALLESASSLRLAVSAASRDDRLFKTEKALMDLAAKNKWLSHRFIFSE